MKCYASTRSSAISDDCRSQTSFSDLTDFDLPEVENLSIHQPMELEHSRSRIRSAG